MAISSTEDQTKGSIQARILTGAAIWGAVTLIVAGVLLVGLFQRSLNEQADRELSNQLIQLVSVTVLRDGSVTLTAPLAEPQFNRPFSGWAWQILREGDVVQQSTSLGPLDGAGALLAPLGTAGPFVGPLGADLRGVARNVQPRFANERLTFAVARPRAELRAAVTRFRTTLIWSLVALAVAQVMTIAWLMRTGLRPLAELRARVADLRLGVATRAAVWPRELAPVARELQASTEHLARLVERARATAADLAHGIKTPLAVIGQISEALDEEAARPLQAQVSRIEASVARHLARMRSGTPGYGQISVADCAADLEVALSPLLRERGVRLILDVPEDAVFRGDEHDFFELLGNPLENAAKWARSQVRVTVRVGEQFEIRVEDDGPGIPEPERQAIFSRGRRLDETVPGHGIGLAIFLDLVALYDGTASLSTADLGGLRLVARFPVAA